MERRYPNFEPTLREHVAQWIKDTAEDSYDGDTQAVIDDLFHGGCQSGMVGHLIYYVDTLAFYEHYRQEIDSMVQQLVEETGSQPHELFAHIGWDTEDPFARETTNQNILAWFGFEEMARQVAIENGLDA
jgi:hypothetical protein